MIQLNGDDCGDSLLYLRPWKSSSPISALGDQADNAGKKHTGFPPMPHSSAAYPIDSLLSRL